MDAATILVAAVAHSHLAGGNFDLPVVGPIFEEYVQSFGLGQRLSFYPGDFFKDSLPSTEVIIMGHILHNWGSGVFGRIEYVDAFRKPRWTNFRFTVSGDLSAGPAQLHPYENGNDAN